MALGSDELYELFLALAPARLAAARHALGHAVLEDKARELQSALIPLAVDAALLGAEGVRALATAAATAAAAPEAALAAALGELERALHELGQSDRSGARIDEAALMDEARRLRELSPDSESPDSESPVTRASGTPPAAEKADHVEAPALSAPSPLERAEELARRVVAEPPEIEELSGVEHWQPALADDMVAAFLDECAERAEGLATRLLELEERGADPELVSEIFRDLHTLKGSSGFAGLHKLNRMAHVAEDLVGELRSGKRTPDRALVDVLLEMLEAVRSILARARAEQPIDVDVADLVARLRDPSLPAHGATPRALDSAADSMAPMTGITPTTAEERAAEPATAAPRVRLGTRARETLRIDFEKVDLLLNLVGEIVLSRGQLAAGQESYSQLLREMTLFRGRLSKALEPLVSSEWAPDLTGTDGHRSAPVALNRRLEASAIEPLLEDLHRIERVFAESTTDLETHVSRLGLAVAELRDTVMKLRMVPIAHLFTKYQRTVRDLSHQLGKQVKVMLSGADTELDKVLVERLDDPLLHLLRNAIDHGIEVPELRERAGKPRAGTLELRALQRGGQIVVLVRDDGAGLDAERLKHKAVEKGLLTPDDADALSEQEAFELIFRPGFSTTEQVSDVSGRGVGMDVVRSTIERLKGGVLVRSELGVGSEFELRLPLTLAITQVLTVRAGSELVALPLDAVASAQTLEDSELEAVAGSPCLRLGEELIPVTDLAMALGLDSDLAVRESKYGSLIVVQVGTERLALSVQHVLGRHEVVIKSLGPLLARTPFAAGATLIGDRMVLVVDLAGVAAHIREPASLTTGASALGSIRAAWRGSQEERKRVKVLVVDDSDAVRETLERELERAGFEVSSAPDGREALELARRTSYDAICTDIMMPKLDGYQLIAALRQLPEYRKTPIVVLSSKDARIDSLRGLDAGADAYLHKPADAGQLIRQLEALLARTMR